jgi:hypothetical protein
MSLSSAAAAMGRKGGKIGGKSRSAAKQRAARKNGARVARMALAARLRQLTDLGVAGRDGGSVVLAPADAGHSLPISNQTRPATQGEI